MPITDMIENPQQRLIPHEGLVIDVNTWTSAHDYHSTHQQRHNMALHSPGIVMGLEITPFDTPDNSIVVNPGAAIDPDGHLIIVGQQQRFVLSLAEPGTLYLILQYREVPTIDTSDENGSRGAEPQFILEAYRVEERRELPNEPYVELARIQVSGTATPITSASDPFNPRPDEIDMRFRNLAGTRPVERVRIGVLPLEITPEGQVTHAPGIMSLLRAINTTTPYQGEFSGSINLNQEITSCELLVMAGQQSFTLAPEWVLVLKRFLDSGGILYAEATGSGTNGDNPFRQSCEQLAGTLMVDLQPIDRDHRLLRMHHIFAQPPSGINNSSLVIEGGGMIYSDANYGSLWDGGPANAPAMRETIRSATEFGVNLCLYASDNVKRQPMVELSQEEDTTTEEPTQQLEAVSDDSPEQDTGAPDEPENSPSE